MRGRWPLTLRGTGALALAVIALVVAQRAAIPELLYFGVLMLALVLCAAASALAVRATGEVVRSAAPEVVEVGGISEVELSVRVSTALPTLPGRWSDTLPAGLDGRAEGAFPAAASTLRRTGTPVRLRYEVRGAVRGIHSVGPLRVSTTDPFGLIRRRFAVGCATDVTVAPTIVELAPLPSSTGEAGGTRQSSALHLGQGADNLVARPYAPGDSMRRIHWRATAHRDTLMVRQEEQESSPAATVVLDRALARWSPAAAEGPGRDRAFETAVSACVSAVARLVHEGYTVDVIDSDGALLADPVDGGEDAEARGLAASFATLHARADGPSRRIVPAGASALLGPVVVVTGRVEPDDLLSLRAAAPRSPLAILLTVSDVGPAGDLRTTTGWHATSLTPGGDVARAWEEATRPEDARVGA
ncbi:MAG: hypothetical protein BGO45_13520 [Microbacterium sp. 71-36]|uniref:DUF58 domain-containing protein n=1 Tax=unclassified Microbacterium TaxID=2609290 RepID=UPI00086DBB6A|nr:MULTISPECIES: DUF58 domain-containing protein [unclassified Microbacterium]ODT37371.1 MAG: hypothetical protein ABS60_13400 [Microbacterium sp. SCN 71-17]OJV78384.1 MAG: hypothetical protein BGO45_13520 [Microbacterium sp. 71-36]